VDENLNTVLLDVTTEFGEGGHLGIRAAQTRHQNAAANSDYY
jgi:hypothetical protein